MTRIALCADSESAKQPALLGLADENFAAQDWLVLYCTAEEARGSLRESDEVEEVWVAASDNMDPVNLAAAVKRDRRERKVCLLAFQGTGSLRSRASAAGVDAMFSHEAFVRRYLQEKRKRTARGLKGVASGAEADVRDGSAPRCSLDDSGKSDELVRALPQDGAERTLLSPKVHAVAQRQAFLLPVASGSGGAGKSTVALLAAVISCRLGYDTLLLDFDLQFGDMREMLGVSDALAIDEGLAAPARLVHLSGKKGKPALLAAPRRLEAYEAIANEASALLDCLMPRFDVIVANTGAAWREEHAALLERSSKALFLVDQRASSLRACKHALELCARCGIATSPFVFAANRCAKGSLFSSIDVSCAMQGAHAVELREGGRDVEELLAAGMPLDLVAERNDLCVSLEEFLVEVLPGHSSAEDAKGSSLESRASAGFGPSFGLFGRRRSRRKGGAL